MSEQKHSGGLFAPDSPLMSGLGRLTVILVVGLLWTITSLPVITAGASSCAAFYVFMKTLRGEEEHYWKDYFRAFGREWRQATAFWLVFLLLGGLFAFCAYYYGRVQTGAQWMEYLFIALLVLLVTVATYVFPLISRFTNSSRNILILGLMLPFKNLKWTVALLLMAAAVILVCVYFTPLIFFGYGLFAFGASVIFVKIFKPLEEAIEEHNKTENNAQ